MYTPFHFFDYSVSGRRKSMNEQKKEPLDDEELKEVIAEMRLP